MLDEIVNLVRGYEGITRKKPISGVVEELASVEDMGRTILGFGEDCAVIDHEDSHLLLAAEGVWSRLLEDPEWAGYCSVLTNVNDIYAMGGSPIAIVNTISFRSESEGRFIASGMRKGSEKFRVPVVGGHIHPDSESSSISTCILGYAENPISSFGCRRDDDIVAAIDLNGKMKSNFLNFDSTSEKSSEDVLRRLQSLVEIANKGFASAAKDISNPGVLGTIAMLLETSKVGAEIDIACIPKPQGVNLNDWLLTYPGCGFIVSSEGPETDEILNVFKSKDMECAVVGQATPERKMRISLENDSRVLFDLDKEIITGATSHSESGGRDE